jgi:UDP-N-acetylglucosamine--N-acetylmuramyl-(pentapeptide) pyrophosphoryl-undecaprenol N-acetylglucosamine transferase
MQNKPTILFVCGRTGGPMFPFLGVIAGLKKTEVSFEPVFVGVKGGFEEVVAKDHNWQLHFLTEVRFKLLSFKTEKLSETLSNYLDFIASLFRLILAFSQSLWLLIKLKPSIIYSAGSFLVVPITYAMLVGNFLKLTRCKLVIHQQDPDVGLSHKLTAKYACIKSCVFDYSRQTFKQFENAMVIENPIDYKVYNQASLEKNIQELFESKPKLAKFLTIQSNKPLWLVFGGGSGAEDINVWLWKNLEQVLKKFRVLHLTGTKQTKGIEDFADKSFFSSKEFENGYLAVSALVKEMPLALKTANLVMCRAGLGSITELKFLQKPAFLVPLPATHQELNASQVANKFYVLHQKDRAKWLETILEVYPNWFEKVEWDKTGQNSEGYWGELNKLIK